MRILGSMIFIFLVGCTTHPTNLEYQAAAKGDVATLDKISGSVINRRNKNGTTLLMVAARNGNLAGVQNLLKRGADPRACDNDGQSVLHYALPTKNKQLLNVLLEAGADPNVTDRFGVTPAEDDTLQDLLQPK